MLKLDAKLDNLPTLIAYVVRVAEEHNLGNSIIPQLELALEELLVNVINYAYPDKKEDIELDCSCSSEEFKITISDSGVPFNILEKEDPDIDLPIEERQIGGLGIYIVKQIMDDIHYKRENEKNILTIIKKL